MVKDSHLCRGFADRNLDNNMTLEIPTQEITGHVEDYIGIYNNTLSEDFCKFLIEGFEKEVDAKVTFNRLEFEGASKNQKADTILLRKDITNIGKYQGQNYDNLVFKTLEKCYKMYCEVFPSLRDGNLSTNALKFQKTGPGEGYHLWHHEQGTTGDIYSHGRALVFMFYLNTLSDKAGGETEFLYQRKRYKPEAGTLLLWPAGYTHAHRGNMVLTEEYKYIITGWFSY